MRVAFVYPNPRMDVAERAARGEAPDTALLGQNHLRTLGVDAFVYDSALRRVQIARGLTHRVTWLLREVTVPWELRSADVIVTPLVTLLPLVARLQRRPRVLLVSYGIHSLWRRSSRARRSLLGVAVRSADRVVTIASSVRDEILRATRPVPERVTFVPFGVDAAFWQPTVPRAGGHVLAVGRDLARDYATFAAALEGTSLRGVVVAKDENLRGVRIPPNVDVKTYIPIDELRQLYADASCVVVPLVGDDDPRGTESSGNTAVLEAMACGHAPVVTERAPLRDYLQPEAATTVPARDAAALRAAIDGVAADAERAAERGARARALVDSTFNTHAFAERLLPILEGLA